MTPVERRPSQTSPSQSSSELLLEHWNIIGEDLTENSGSTTVSTWQEEAHWMSFRHAVQKFALLSASKNTSTIDEGNELSDGDSASGSEKWNSQRSVMGNALSLSSSSSDDSALASNLAETRMRLALAQAERDELEFVLLQHQHKGSSGTTVSYH